MKDQRAARSLPSPLREATVVSLAELRPYPGNPRRGNLAAIKESLEVNGLYRPVVVRRKTNEVLAGNHTLAAAKDLGWSEIAVTYVDVDAEQAARIVLADNRTNDLATYDEQALADLLQTLAGLEGTGYGRDDLDRLLASLGAGFPEDEPPRPAPKPKTKPGDLFALGPHRLLCGDAREEQSYRKLLGEEKADLLWTDPPYGVSYVGKTERKLRIAGDQAAGLSELLVGAFAQIDRALRPGAPLYVAHPAGELSLSFGQAFCGVGWSLRQTLVWVKDSIVLGHCDYHYRHEPILYGYKRGSGRRGRGSGGWHGDDSQASVLEVPRPKASEAHPTMKPPELIELCLRNSSRAGALVVDPFAGSGSTLVACEQSGRVARLVELDPAYCDVILARWVELGGAKPRKVAHK